MLDDLDRRILLALSPDPRRPLARLAEDLGVAPATLHQRVRKLQERGIIRGARLIIDWEQVGLPVVAIVNVAVSQSGPLEKVAELFSTIPYVQDCYASTGEFDLFLVVRARSSAHLGEVLEAIRDTTTARTQTQVVLSTYFEYRLPPID